VAADRRAENHTSVGDFPQTGGARELVEIVKSQQK